VKRKLASFFAAALTKMGTVTQIAAAPSMNGWLKTMNVKSLEAVMDTELKFQVTGIFKCALCFLGTRKFSIKKLNLFLWD
jgi:hypothetical protein